MRPTRRLKRPQSHFLWFVEDLHVFQMIGSIFCTYDRIVDGFFVVVRSFCSYKFFQMFLIFIDTRIKNALNIVCNIPAHFENIRLKTSRNCKNKCTRPLGITKNHTSQPRYRHTFLQSTATTCKTSHMPQNSKCGGGGVYATWHLQSTTHATK